MSEYERAVLTVLSRAIEPLGWYRIEIRLGGMPLVSRPNLLVLLEELVGRSFVEEFPPLGPSGIRYGITPVGRIAIGIVS